ncbi:hypothetical protein HPB49_003837 [Dermacentor silvarum]|uniref:Uncharacterized protein n=1 Tax=Dermacentor silvarum TaxID=543639 RepID=A0ACB8DI80_DERSI|nr:hypothetical protein HPB49_003837 [Dermacentor silvarum]
MTNLRSPMAEVLHARMMGNSTTVIITFSGNRVPLYSYYYDAEYRCNIHKPREQLSSPWVIERTFAQPQINLGVLRAGLSTPPKTMIAR